MTETEQFLATMSPRITEAETALHNGDPGPRIAMWSRAEPVTLFGAAMSGRGWAEIGTIFGALGKQFSNCLSYENQIVDRRGLWRSGVHRRTGAHNGLDQRRRAQAVRAARDDDLPARGRRMEGRAPPRRRSGRGLGRGRWPAHAARWRP